MSKPDIAPISKAMPEMESLTVFLITSPEQMEYYLIY